MPDPGVIVRAPIGSSGAVRLLLVGPSRANARAMLTHHVRRETPETAHDEPTEHAHEAEMHEGDDPADEGADREHDRDPITEMRARFSDRSGRLRQRSALHVGIFGRWSDRHEGLSSAQLALVVDASADRQLWRYALAQRARHSVAVNR
jgi:hypothetical protein